MLTIMSKKSNQRDPSFTPMFLASSVAFERDAQHVSRRFLRALAEPTEKTSAGK
jgi:hypothetical protein